MPIRLRGINSFTKEHTVVLLLFNSFFWYFIGQSIVGTLATVFNENLALYLEAAFPLSILISSLIGSILLSKIQEKKALCIWLFFGTLASFLPALPIGYSFVGSILIIVILGTSFGLGMPLLLNYFTKTFPIENRGMIGGLTFFLVTISAPLFIILVNPAQSVDLMPSIVFFTAWRFWSIPMLLAYFNDVNKSESTCTPERSISFSSLFQNRPFVLYFIAWLMFSMLDAFEPLATSPAIGDFRYAMNIIEPIIAGVSALIAGILADRAGRKRVIIFGFVSLGVAYAILGLARHMDISWYFYFVADGLAIGALWSIFTIVIWGELAKHRVEKYYAIGEAPLFLTQILYLLLKPYVGSLGLDTLSTAFSLAAFFLFIAVIPLLYAPETLPEKKIQQRQLRIYTEEALKLRQKVEQK